MKLSLAETTPVKPDDLPTSTVLLILGGLILAPMILSKLGGTKAGRKIGL